MTITSYLNRLTDNSVIMVLFVFIALDCVLGTLRAIKFRKFNSTVGIDGIIRKSAMIFCVIILCVADMIISFNLIGFIPDKITQHLGNPSVGICDFFCILFILYEAVSVLKNMSLCGLPVSRKLNEKLKQLLNLMTDELNENNK